MCVEGENVCCKIVMEHTGEISCEFQDLENV